MDAQNVGEEPMWDPREATVGTPALGALGIIQGSVIPRKPAGKYPQRQRKVATQDLSALAGGVRERVSWVPGGSWRGRHSGCFSPGVPSMPPPSPPGPRPMTCLLPPPASFWATLWGSHLGRLSWGTYPASAWTQGSTSGVTPRDSGRCRARPYCCTGLRPPVQPQTDGAVRLSQLSEGQFHRPPLHAPPPGEKAQGALVSFPHLVPCSLGLSFPISQEGAELCDVVCMEQNPLPPAVSSWGRLGGASCCEWSAPAPGSAPHLLTPTHVPELLALDVVLRDPTETY